MKQHTARFGGVLIKRVLLHAVNEWPNNANYPLIVYCGAYDSERDGDGRVLLQANGWTSPWAWGVFDFHHYHSTAWEALLCVRGEAEVQFGGPTGPVLHPSAGDLLLVPPGVVHKQLSSGGGFTLLGAYPDHDGCRTPEADTVRGPPTDRQAANIRKCPPPQSCPLFGMKPPWDGSLAELLDTSEPDLR